MKTQEKLFEEVLREASTRDEESEDPEFALFCKKSNFFEKN